MRNQSLDHARLAYRQAYQDPAVRSSAPITLQESASALRQAERIWYNRGHWHKVHQFAALAEQKAEAARRIARTKTANVETPLLREERNEQITSRQVRTYVPERAPQEITTPPDPLPAHKPLSSLSGYVRQPALAPFNPEATERGVIFTVEDTLFELGDAQLKPGAMRRLHPLLTFLKEHSTHPFLITGDAANVESKFDRRDLSRRRAEEVRDFLVVNGIDPVRITVRGKNTLDTPTSYVPETTRQQSPQVQVIVMDEGEWTSR